MSLSKNILKSKDETNKKSILEIICLVLGFPIWLLCLIAAFSIFLSIYIILWSLIICFWAILASLLGFSIGMILSGIPIFFETNLIGIAMISVGIICIGLAILLFFICKMTTNGIVVLTRKITLWIKSIFFKKEEANE